MFRTVLGVLALLLAHNSFSQDKDSVDRWTFRFMNTVVQQGHEGFHPPYHGIKSLDSMSETQITVRNTWFLGRRLTNRTSIYINPELAGGSGLSGVAGIAGFPNGEAFRVGSGSPKIYVARFFIRHEFPLTKETVLVEDGINQLKERLAVKRLTLTVGKFSLLDYFDNSNYANDGRTQFMNWALMTGGAYDFASDTRGNTWGAVLEYITPKRSIRFAITTPSSTPNGPKFDFDLLQAHGINLEYRRLFTLFGRMGHFGVVGFYNSTLGVRFTDAVYTAPDSIARMRTSYHGKYGVVLKLEQEQQNFGWFINGSWADGKTENFGFTQIDRSIMAGIVVGGIRWRRPNDKIGLAGTINGLSPEQANFLERGGNGFIIGDGRLRYATERAAEVYYSIRVHNNIFLTLDYQYIWDMAFNADRGNIGVWAIRSHVEL